MKLPPSSAKILKKEFANLISVQDWLFLLSDGHLDDFERLLYEKFMNLYDLFSEVFISFLSSSQTFNLKQEEKAKELGLSKLELRQVELQLRTGTKIKFKSLYAKKVSKGYKKDRHLSMLLWKCIKKSSPEYASITTLLSVICPSFDVAEKVMLQLGIKANQERIRTLSLKLATECISHRAKSQIAPNESLEGKRVIIGIDGGRTRTRVYPDPDNVSRNQKYDTPWIEPKLFVIATIDENGKTDKKELPIYDSTFGDDELFDVLEQYLHKLKIELAESVQILGDGAPWIWNRAKAMLLQLGVKNEKITETLDYYHAKEHLTDMMIYVDKDKKEKLLPKFKKAIWEGNIKALKRLVKKGIKGVNLNKFTPYNYFLKNKQRIDYQSFRKKKYPIGSGIIESGIRRIINLRFKAPSSFWYPQNVEKLILMRAIALSGRWNIMQANLQKI